MILDIADFRLAFPAFADDELYPDPLLNRKMAVAKCYIEDNSCVFDDECRQLVYQLMVAHLLRMDDNIAKGLPGRLVVSGTEGPVSVSFAEPPTKSNFIFWLQATPYGVELSALLSVNAIGDYYGGNLSLHGFRKF